LPNSRPFATSSGPDCGSELLFELVGRLSVNLKLNYVKKDHRKWENKHNNLSETEGMRQLAQVYLHHSAEFWRPTETLNWLEMATHRVLPNLQTLRRTEMDEWAKRFAQLGT
jgi:hypothetical protein